eukprot:COSAG01_NODE_2474_length_7623_cov_9.861111_4_plen_87_part_00
MGEWAAREQALPSSSVPVQELLHALARVDCSEVDREVCLCACVLAAELTDDDATRVLVTILREDQRNHRPGLPRSEPRDRQRERPA